MWWRWPAEPSLPHIQGHGGCTRNPPFPLAAALVAPTNFPTRHAGIGADKPASRAMQLGSWKLMGADNWQNQLDGDNGFRDDKCDLSEPDVTERSSLTDSHQYQAPTHSHKSQCTASVCALSSAAASSEAPVHTPPLQLKLWVSAHFPRTLVRELSDPHGTDT